MHRLHLPCLPVYLDVTELSEAEEAWTTGAVSDRQCKVKECLKSLSTKLTEAMNGDLKN